MQKIRTKNGLIAYHTTTSEITLIGGLGICDECGEASLEGGYLVPVLNHWQCPKCFNEWKDFGKFYPEDAPIETKNAAYYEAMIPITEWPQDCKDCPCASNEGKCMELNPADGTPPCDGMKYTEFVEVSDG